MVRSHDCPVTQQVLDIVLDHMAKASAERVLRIDLVIGEMTGFADDSTDCTSTRSARTRRPRRERQARSPHPVPSQMPVVCGSEFEPEEWTGSVPHCGAGRRGACRA